MVAEFNWPDDVTLEVVEQFRQEYAYHYNLRECAMLLAVVLPGSFIVTWFIPESIVEKLKSNFPMEFSESINSASFRLVERVYHFHQNLKRYTIDCMYVCITKYGSTLFIGMTMVKGPWPYICHITVS